jgi:hypothetical protein
MFLQFIYGKLVSNKASGYQLVARSANLTNEANLKTMAGGTHCFWGSEPLDSKVTAIGIFLQGSNLVLVKAETAVDQNEKLAVNGDRGFDQHRYVFIPTTSMSALQGRAFKLLAWMLNQPIPLMTVFNDDLEPLSIPILEEPISAKTIDIDIEINKIRQCWPDSNEQKPLVLSALSAIINGKRLLLTNEKTAIPFQNWMESILLLLPASIRSQISVAIGILDERECPWAILVIKTNQHSYRSLPENMIWLNRASQKFYGQFDDNIFENPYVNFIRDHITTAPDTLKHLIQQLDKIADNDITLETLAGPEIIARLIPALPEEKQNKFFEKYLFGLSLDIWEKLIPPIINENCQHGLIFAWKELGQKAISEPQAITLMLQVWSQLLNAKLIMLLDELNKNLPLAAILLKDKLLLNQTIRESETTTICPRRADGLNTSEIQPYQPLLPDYSEGYDPDAPSELSNTPSSTSLSSSAIVEKLIALCQNVVANQANFDWLESWQFATNLATHNFFADEKTTFLLFDATLLGEITVKYLYNCFALKLGILLPSIEVEQFKQSNLCQQFTRKNAEVANLLYTLLAGRNLCLAKLPQIAKLTDMNYREKNNLYEAFLRTWSPSKENARPLLVSVIKENQTLPNNFSRNNFRQTYTWFEQQQPGLKAVFDSLEQDYSCENWVNLAQAIYETHKEQTELMDTLVGNIFPVAVMQKWLQLIADNDNIRTNVIDKSSAWQALTLVNFHQLVRSSQQYVIVLMRCLRDGDGSRFPWIKGDLLHYLCRTWIQQKGVDEDLRDVITSPSVTDTFTTEDWLLLQWLSWEPGIQLEVTLGVNTPLTSDQTHSLLLNAKTIVARYDSRVQTRRLFNDCVGWGLDLAELKEILKGVQPSVCNADLIIPYLYREGKAINPVEEQQLIGLLLQMKLNQEERSDVEKFSFDIFIQYILPSRNWPMLKWWRDKAAEEELYKKAFSNAVHSYAQNISITDFFNYIKELKTASLIEESGLMFKAAFSWMPDLLIQPIIHFLHGTTF